MLLLRIKSLKELREMDISDGCPTIEGLPDTADPTKYYPYILGILSQKWVNVGSILEYIDYLRKSNDMWRYSEDELWSKFEDMLTNQSKDLQVENDVSNVQDKHD
jgi:hypothetical protein